MAEVKKVDFEDSAHILDEEDEATLAILKQRVKAADEGRLVTSEEVRRRMKKWLTKSSTPKTH
jgi:predicted transcriptional regulator